MLIEIMELVKINSRSPILAYDLLTNRLEIYEY